MFAEVTIHSGGCAVGGRSAREVPRQRVEHQVVDGVVVERDDRLEVLGLEVLEGLRVAALADDLTLSARPAARSAAGSPAPSALLTESTR